MSVFAGPEISNNGLILCLDASNIRSYPGSGATWFDISGNGYNGTLTNGPTFNTGNKGSIVFNGTNNYIENGTLSIFNFGTNNFSVSFWIYPTAWADGTSRGIIDKKTNDSTNGWTIYNDGAGGRQLKINARLSLQNNFPSASNVTINSWQNWVFVRSSTTLYWYLNGNLDFSQTGVTIANLSDSASIQVGRSKTWGGWFSGRMSLIKIYNRELSQLEIQQNFQALRGRYGI